jgi:hypothetical protein
LEQTRLSSKAPLGYSVEFNACFNFWPGFVVHNETSVFLAGRGMVYANYGDLRAKTSRKRKLKLKAHASRQSPDPEPKISRLRTVG